MKSNILKYRLITSFIKKILIDCVLPGVLLVLASFLLLVNALITLDFPEFDLPQNAISSPKSSGKPLCEGKLPINIALVNVSLVVMSLLNCRMLS